MPVQIFAELLLIVALLLCNGVFAMSEIAVVTARRVRLSRRAEAGDGRARAALELAAEPTQFLSTVQVGITLIATLAGAYGGATIAEELAPLLGSLPVIGPYGEGVALGLVVAVITFLSVVIGELVPKRLALAYPETIAAWVARPMQLLARIGRPIVALLTGSTEFVLRLFRFRGNPEPNVTEDDIRALVAQGTASGAVDEEEEEILHRVLHLGDRPAAAIMTPRTEVEWIDVTADTETLREALEAHGRSSLLVCEGSIENVAGVIRPADVLSRCLRGDRLDMVSLLRQPLMVPETVPLLQLLIRFRQSEAETAVVLDEFGGVQGVVTLADIMRDLVADIPGPAGTGEPDIVRRSDGSWLVDGGTAMDMLDEELDLERPAAERGRGYRTLAGFIMAELGRVPAVGERLERWGYAFEVVDMDGRRIDRVLVSPVTPVRQEPATGDSRQR
ncbi:MAG TPA: hemolysin family protein [Gemmatimonadales bacterium]